MLNHKWMPKRDRSIRRSTKDAEDLLAAGDEAFAEEPEAGLADAIEAQSQEGQEMPLAQAPAGPAAMTEHQPTPDEQADTPRGETTSPAHAPDPVTAAAPPAQDDAAPEPDPVSPVPEAHDGDARAAPETAPEPAGDHADQEAQAPRPATRRDPRAVADRLQVPQTSLRDRLESVLSHQAQLPLDIDARHAVSAGAEGSPRETRELLLQRLLDPTLTLQEAATLLGVCTTTIRRYTDRGLLRCFRTPGNQRRFHLSDVLDFMEKQQRSG